MLSLTLRLKLTPTKRIPVSSSANKPPNSLAHFGNFPSPHRHRIPTLAAKNDNSELKNDPTGSDGGGGEENRRWILDGIRWRDLVLNPDPDNVVAVGLTGLLTWASVQVLWQLLFISLAILIAAVKYSLVAALLIFVLITLL